jgi:hypothetical protein
LTEHGEIASYARQILALYKEAEHRLSRDSGGLVRIGAPGISISHAVRAAWAILRPLSAVRLQIELGIGPDISALLDEGRARSRDRQQRNQGGRRRLAVPRAGVWAAGRAMHLDPRRPAPLRSIRPIAGGGSSLWRNSTAPAGRGLSCCRAQARRYTSQPSRRACHHDLSRVQPAE